MDTVLILLLMMLILIAVVGFVVGFIGGIAWLATVMAILTGLYSYILVNLLEN